MTTPVIRTARAPECRLVVSIPATDLDLLQARHVRHRKNRKKIHLTPRRERLLVPGRRILFLYAIRQLANEGVRPEKRPLLPPAVPGSRPVRTIQPRVLVPTTTRRGLQQGRRRTLRRLLLVRVPLHFVRKVERKFFSSFSLTQKLLTTNHKE